MVSYLPLPQRGLRDRVVRIVEGLATKQARDDRRRALPEKKRRHRLAHQRKPQDAKGDDSLFGVGAVEELRAHGDVRTQVAVRDAQRRVHVVGLALRLLVLQRLVTQVCVTNSW